jgi:hypothetical protein
MHVDSSEDCSRRHHHPTVLQRQRGHALQLRAVNGDGGDDDSALLEADGLSRGALKAAAESPTDLPPLASRYNATAIGTQLERLWSMSVPFFK